MRARAQLYALAQGAPRVAILVDSLALQANGDALGLERDGPDLGGGWSLGDLVESGRDWFSSLRASQRLSSETLALSDFVHGDCAEPGACVRRALDACPVNLCNPHLRQPLLRHAEALATLRAGALGLDALIERGANGMWVRPSSIDDPALSNPVTGEEMQFQFDAEQAAVTWTTSDEFGPEFLRLTSSGESRFR